ncbi:VOC family protein [Polaribacter uvawellassae]|uniref:VOC family protein n=1 Tax=Polaribacter uvawellassae TaxID=3133495 RepID=UPI00321C31D7
MTKIDPIIAVKDVNESAEWYQKVFDCKRTHGGNEFAVLEDENGEILICLHKWGEHEHPTMTIPNIKPGNGLIIYYKTDKLDIIRSNIKKMDYPIEKEIHINPNSTKKEFSLRDPDGYYLTITEYHKYEG